MEKYNFRAKIQKISQMKFGLWSKTVTSELLLYSSTNIINFLTGKFIFQNFNNYVSKQGLVSFLEDYEKTETFLESNPFFVHEVKLYGLCTKNEKIMFCLVHVLLDTDRQFIASCDIIWAVQI